MLEIEVLLATYNGENFIIDFLESLSNQNKVKINLLVSDDDSSDQTLALIENYRSRFNSLNYLKGPKRGTKFNFYNLLKHSKGQYIAYADQDDIWNQDKLINAVSQLEGVNSPSLVVGNYSINGRSRGMPPYLLYSSFFRNRSKGCTMLFNSELRDLVKILDFNNVVMHDWATLLVAQIYGKVYFCKDSLLAYRIHGNNVVGEKPFAKKFIDYSKSIFSRGSRHFISNQMAEIIKLDNKNEKLQVKFIKDWIAYEPRPFYFRLLFVLKNSNNFNLVDIYWIIQYLLGIF